LLTDKIDISDYDYELPKERIAQYPVEKRDDSRLLILKQQAFSHVLFRDICDHIPAGSLLVFNNSRVIKARLLFGKESGAVIEVLCLEPLSPPGYDLSLGTTGPVEWKCIVGNLKKWKRGKIKTPFMSDGKEYSLEAERLYPEEAESWRIRFTWEEPSMTFGEMMERAGHVPLPPYIERKDESSDSVNYQTVYSKIPGSVAAPTAGLHFSDEVLEKLRERNIHTCEITLHVGAGTFQPVKNQNAMEHEMHSEHFLIRKETIDLLARYHGRIIPVGTTSVRTLESIYHIAAGNFHGNAEIFKEPRLGQWDAYETDENLSAPEALVSLSATMDRHRIAAIRASTGIMIVPGYRFMMTKGMITNFHQPKSTLLLLIAAFIGERWKEAYRYALERDFRFLSYGDSSLLLP
jgi:S-adenosylmethionine:tRNA ribosyltransferase-isomerase